MQITINNRIVQVESGDTIYVAAAKGGIHIPSLCASAHLSPYGSCRLCVGEIVGLAGLHATCSMPVRDGMVVRTESETLTRHRRNLIELYLSESLDPAFTQELQKLAQAYRVTSIRYPPGAKRAPIRDESSPFFIFDNARCISCARCVRACDEIQPAFALSMVGAGFAMRPAWGRGGLTGTSDIASSTCVSCGACVKECPTGALTEKTVYRQGTPVSWVRTTCGYCGVGCAFNAGVRDGSVVQMVPADDGPSNVGHACMKGRFGWTYVSAPDRLRTPLLRNGGTWKPLPWGEALDRIAEEFTRITTQHGSDALATISSSRGTN